MRTRKIVTILLTIALTLATLPMAGCGNSTTLARVAAVCRQAAQGYKTELSSLRVGGVLSAGKFGELDRQADEIIVSANAFADYLDGFDRVTASNKAEILAKIAEGVGLARGVSQNARLGGVPADSTAFKLLTIAIVTLDNASLTIAALNPPKAAQSFALGSEEPGIEKTAVQVKLPRIPKAAEKYFQ